MPPIMRRSVSATNTQGHPGEIAIDRPGLAKHEFASPSGPSPEDPAGPSGINGVLSQYSDSEYDDMDEGTTTADEEEDDEDDEEYEDAKETQLRPPPRSQTMPTDLDRVQTDTPGHEAPPVPTLHRAQTVSDEPQPHATALQSVQTAFLGRQPALPRSSDLRQWQTETTRTPHPLALRQTGTCRLNTAIWQRCDAEYASSSSDEEDAECVPAADSDAQAQDDRAKKGREGRKQAGAQHAYNRPEDALLRGADEADKRYRRFLVGNENYQTKGKVKKDGRLRISVNEINRTGYIAKALGAAIHKMKPGKESMDRATKVKSRTRGKSPTPSFSMRDIDPRPRINIVIMVIGSRGDVQPFLKIGGILKNDYGHRVRIATHPAFRDYVEQDSDLEFFSVGGDPSELMSFMVKNPGMIPTLEAVRAGDIGKRRAAMAEMFDGFWRACINATDDEKDRQNLKMMGEKYPFVADAIIANPPSFAHIHCAEALGIPLHLMFTFPYSPTQEFPHPLASIKKSNVDPGYTNFMSYPMVEMMIWQGLGDLVNNFRVKTLGLDPVSTLWAPGATYRLHVPFTYLWSPSLVPKPRDWGPEIDIAGFVYLDLGTNFTPPDDLAEFLAKGEPPVYIGFGSIVVDDADAFTQMIFEGVKKAGVRALVSRGWGGLGTAEVPDNIFMLGNTPHDWLFPKVKACVIHGGAGTTAMALKTARPIMVVPFFGDQHFWGNMVYKSGVGPEPVPHRNLTSDNLAEGIKFCLTDKARAAVAKISREIASEGDGAANAVLEFHRHLNLRGPNTMRCSLLKDHIATWQPKRTGVKLSPLAADILVGAGLTDWEKLRLLRHKEWSDFEGPGEPLTGFVGSITHTVHDTFEGIGSVPFRLAKTSRKYRKRLEKKKKMREAMATNQMQEGAGTDGEAASVEQDMIATEPDESLTPMRTTTRDIREEFVGDVTTGVEMTASAIALAPFDLSLALAQGFHNAPRLYGDDTVRKPIRICGIRSGLKAARKEFVYGVYDGFTGVIRLPIRGAKNNGVAGFIKGTGMGLVGLVVKNLGAIISPFGYALQGVVKQFQKRKNPRKFIRRARIVQGQREIRSIPAPEEKKIEKTVIEGYHVMHDLCDAITADERERGIAGQLDRVFVDTAVLFEDVDIAKRALRALKRGESVDDVVHSPLDRGVNQYRHEKKNKRRSLGKATLGTKSLNRRKGQTDANMEKRNYSG